MVAYFLFELTRLQVKSALQSNFPDYDVVEFLGTDTVRQQLETFARAAMIIAPHGAGLANILVSPLHTPVLEIAPINCPPCFLRLALKVRNLCPCNGTCCVSCIEQRSDLKLASQQ